MEHRRGLLTPKSYLGIVREQYGYSILGLGSHKTGNVGKDYKLLLGTWQGCSSSKKGAVIISIQIHAHRTSPFTEVVYFNFDSIIYPTNVYEMFNV